jgi:hypothetical protein
MPERKCCPECESTAIEHILQDPSYTDTGDASWWCRDCSASLTEADTRHVTDDMAMSGAGVLSAAGFDEHAEEAREDE